MLGRVSAVRSHVKFHAHKRDSLICLPGLHIFTTLRSPQRYVMGVVEEVGSGVTDLRPGDRLVVPFVIACGECFHCRLAEHAAWETTNTGKGAMLNGKGIRPLAALFGYSHLYGGVSGGQAEKIAAR